MGRLSQSSTGVPTGTYARASSAQYVAGRRWGFLGDSITDGAGSSNYVNSFSRQAVHMAGTQYAAADSIEAGVSGETSALAKVRLPAVISAGAKGLVVELGANDAGQPVPLAQYQANISEIVSGAKAAGIPVVLCTVPPRRGSGVTTALRALINSYNLWLRLWGPANGCVIADVHAALVDPAADTLAAAYDSGDGLHPSNRGHQRMAQVVATAMRQAMPNRPAGLIVDKSPLNLVPNPLMTGAGDIPDQWFEQPGGSGAAATYSTAADTTGLLPAGRWMRMELDATSGASTRRLACGIPNTGWAPGDKLVVSGVVLIEDMAGTWPALIAGGQGVVGMNVLNQNAQTIQVAYDDCAGLPIGTNLYSIGPIFAPITVPSGTTDLLYWLGVGLPTGAHVRASWGALGIINATALGLDAGSFPMVSL